MKQISVDKSYFDFKLGLDIKEHYSTTDMQTAPGAIIVYCEAPCGGNIPCINICPHDVEDQATNLAMMTDSGDYYKLSLNVSNQLFNNSILPLAGK